MESPSPTMSMLRSILWSLCSFLLRASSPWEVGSLGAGFTTFPLHSTLKYSKERAVSFCSQSDHAAHLLIPQHVFSDRCAACMSTYIVYGDDAPFSYELKGLLIVSVIVKFISIDEHKVICSSFPGCYEFIWWNRWKLKCKKDSIFNQKSWPRFVKALT